MNIVIRLQRDLDIKGASLLQQQLRQCLKKAKTAPKSYWIIDLTEVERIDHFGLFTLVKMRRLAREHRCHLRLCNAKRSIMLMLEIAELDRKFKILENPQDHSNVQLLRC
ncbi:MAG: STAS domain-containing protein [Jaaginema sp. PMC 1079.18]|nr:STAS domain-containing protein [Jaaginema sp. PMC 1079.18]MEC4865015.1 STAS domain-containing protein [Jaaginema sp. PMC 1078.18]